MKSFNKIVSNFALRYLPDAYIFCLILTFLVFMMASLTGGLTFPDLFLSWGNGFFGLLGFTLQMAMVLVSGFTLARTKLISHLLDKIISYPKSAVGAHLLVSFISIVACFLNWGFGLIVSGILAVKMASKRADTSFTLLVASAYAGFLVWHGGLSGSIPLSLTSVSSELKPFLGVDSIPLSSTLLSPLNTSLLLCVSLTILFCVYLLVPKNHHEKLSLKDEKREILADKIDSFSSFSMNSKFFTLLISFISFFYLLFYFYRGGGVTLNIVIFIFLFLGILLHGSPRKFLFHFEEAVKGSAGILLQFPFYAGIMALMQDSGLAEIMSNFFVEISSKETLPLFTYYAAGIVNFFVPSGGGQWAIQGPIMMKAASELGANKVNVAMAIAWGDAWTNMIQPFWALPLLSLAGLELKHIIGQLFIIFLSVGVVSSLIFLLF